jgi:hypothetical protein
VKKTKTDRDIEDIEFIVDELVRFASMDAKTMIGHLKENKNDAWFNLPHPRNDGSILTIGEAAGHRLYDLASRHLATTPDLNNDFEIGAFIAAVKKEFVLRFLKNGEKELSQRTIDKMLSAAVKRTKRSHKALTHYIPCVVVSSDQPEAFRVGPVVFHRMEKFLEEHKEAFEISRQQIREDHIRRCQEAIASGRPADTIATPDISEGIANRLVTETTEYFQQFKWLAMVSIPACDIKISRKRAERTIEAALDVLKLFFARLHGQGLRQGHSVGVRHKIANLTAEADGKLDFSYGWRTQDTPTGKDWTNVLKNPDGAFAAAASALNACRHPQSSSHLIDRYLDAMAWYGQAVSESQTSVQIVKYVAALERLTITKKLEGGLTNAVIRRTALLTSDDATVSYESASKNAGTVYDCRSRLMHGSVSPFDRELDTIVPLAEKITRIALFNSLRLFTELANKIKNATANDLEAAYVELEEAVKSTADGDDHS